jgi:hypothetical protein
MAGMGQTAGAWSQGLTLAGLKAGIRLVNDKNAPLAPDNLVVPVPATQRFQ